MSAQITYFTVQLTHTPLQGGYSHWCFACQHSQGHEYWSARDLQKLLGYDKWQNFKEVIKKAEFGCKIVGQNPSDHFTNVSKMIKTGKGAKRKIEDCHLTRYACYITAMAVGHQMGAALSLGGITSFSTSTLSLMKAPHVDIHPCKGEAVLLV